jgi:DNA-binding response OmpR family regulator
MATILVIEDDPSIRKLAAVNLRARGHRVIEADSAETGLTQWRDCLPALVLLDIKLPGMRGWDMLTTISADSEVLTAPVIVMTASGIDVEASARRFPNVVKVLIKPFDIHDLIRAVETTLGKSGGP